MSYYTLNIFNSLDKTDENSYYYENYLNFTSNPRKAKRFKDRNIPLKLIEYLNLDKTYAVVTYNGILTRDGRISYYDLDRILSESEKDILSKDLNQRILEDCK